MINIQIWLVLVSISCAGWALLRLMEERGEWEEDKSMMTHRLKNQKETIDELQQKLVDNVNAHNAWVVIAKKNYKHLKRQIANRDGQITKLKQSNEILIRSAKK